MKECISFCEAVSNSFPSFKCQVMMLGVELRMAVLENWGWKYVVSSPFFFQYYIFFWINLHLSMIEANILQTWL